MADRALAAKKPEAKKESPPPQTRKVEHFQPVSSPVDRILYLQRTAGNRAVQGLIRSGALQAKLRVGPPGDKYEEEADRVAQQVVAFKRDRSQHPGLTARITGARSLPDERKKEVRRKTEPASETSIVPVNDSYILNPGSGEPLNISTRGSIESYTGADMSNVRVHNDSASHAAAGALNARAFTYREHIWLGRGESQTDLRLMAHETTHVLQQGASVRRLPVAVTPAPQVIQRGLFDIIGDAKDKLLEKAAQWVENIPGFHLLTVILGKNPITDKPVERNAINLIRGFLGLLPGGEAIFQNLQKSGAIEQAFAWLNDQIAKLNLTWDYIKSLFRQAWDALSATDIFSPGKAIEKLKAVFGPPLERIKNFAVAVGKKIAEFIFEGVLKLAGPLGTRVLGIVRKAGDVLSTIIHDPIGFVGNLIQAVRKGFDKFSTNILAHLKEGLMKWLFGALAGAGLRLPQKFDLIGILSLVLQILALTYDRLRGLLVKAIGEKPVAYLEKTFEFLTTLVTKGLGAAWEKIVEFLGDLKEMVLGGIRDWVVTTIVKKAITKIASMFNPVGAVIQAIIMVYDTVKFFIERFQQIAELANAVFESVASIAAGKVEAAAGYVEKTMARTIPVIIGFLASLIGLGGISQKIKDIIKTIQNKVESALSKLVNFIVSKVKGLLGKDKEGKPGKAETPEERWDNGVKGVKAAVAKLEKEGVSEEKVKAQLPKWKTDFGFKGLSVDTKQKPWVIMGEMSPAKPVASVDVTDESKAAPDGSPNRPYWIKWHKPPTADLKSINLKPTPDKDEFISVSPTSPVEIIIAKPNEVAWAQLSPLKNRIAKHEKDLRNFWGHQAFKEKYSPEVLEGLRNQLESAQIELTRIEGLSKKEQRGIIGPQRKLVKKLQQESTKVEKIRQGIARIPELEKQLSLLKKELDDTWELLKRNSEYTEEKESIGISRENQIYKERVIGPHTPRKPRKMQGKFRDFLQEAGYDMTAHGEDADHVTELSLNGPDTFNNLWPLGDKNIIPNQRVNLETGKEVGQFPDAGTNGDLITDKGKFLDKKFIIKGFK